MAHEEGGRGSARRRGAVPTADLGFVARSVAPVFPVRMLALDIDGTLVGDELVLHERTRTAVIRAVHRGLHVSLVTGRMTASALRFAQMLELRDPLVGYQGALIRSMPAPSSSRAGRMLRHRPLPADVARDAVAWSAAVGLDPHANHLEALVMRADDPRFDDYSAFLGSQAFRVPDLVEWIRKPVTKIVAVGEPPLPMELLGVARERFAGRAEATVAHPRFLEFIAPGVSKGAAVRWLARRHGVPLGQVLAIGDQMNDLEMLAAVGHGTAMPSAPADVVATARYVAPPLEEEGAAQVIEAVALAPDRAARRASELFELSAGRAPAMASPEAR
jgi:Cof subfamily protein (haloacid dehalogenase superfamily)